MNRRAQATMGAVAILSMAMAATTPARAEEGADNAKGKAADKTGKGYTAAFVMDPATRKVYYEENADTVLPVASMAKMMTCLIAVERIKHGLLELDKQVTISAR